VEDDRVGTDEDFAAYMAARWPAFVRMAVLLGCSRHEAEDVAQTAFARCFVSWSKVARADDPDAYAYRVLINVFNDSRRTRWWRREKPTADIPDDVTAPTDATTDVDRADSVDRALAGLGAGQREVVVLRFYAGLTEAGTAEALDVPVGTVKSRQARALKQLRDSVHLTDEPTGRRS
jgi:RNA polymerase sigma-70 factor (sigma-E family)